MFRGLAAINLDSKGRMAVPTRYREALQDDSGAQIVVTIDTEEPCLLLYPMSAWESIEKKLEALPSFDKGARRIQRLLMGHATELELDANGRILLPALLREYAHLEKNVMLVGQGKKFELWDQNYWERGRGDWLDATQSDAGDLPDAVKNISL